MMATEWSGCQSVQTAKWPLRSRSLGTVKRDQPAEYRTLEKARPVARSVPSMVHRPVCWANQATVCDADRPGAAPRRHEDLPSRVADTGRKRPTRLPTWLQMTRRRLRAGDQGSPRALTVGDGIHMAGRPDPCVDLGVGEPRQARHAVAGAAVCPGHRRSADRREARAPSAPTRRPCLPWPRQTVRPVSMSFPVEVPCLSSEARPRRAPLEPDDHVTTDGRHQTVRGHDELARAGGAVQAVSPPRRACSHDQQQAAPVVHASCTPGSR